MLPPTFVVSLDHLLKAGRARPGDHVIGQQDRERLVADELAGAPHGMAQSQRLLLTGIEKFAGADFGCPDRIEHVELATGFQYFIEIAIDIEVVFDGGFTLAGDEDDILNSGRACFLDGVLEISGLSTRGSISLGIALVAGRNRVPSASHRENRLSHCFTHMYLFSLRVDGGDNPKPKRPKAEATLSTPQIFCHKDRLRRNPRIMTSSADLSPD